MSTRASVTPKPHWRTLRPRPSVIVLSVLNTPSLVRLSARPPLPTVIKSSAPAWASPPAAAAAAAAAAPRLALVVVSPGAGPEPAIAVWYAASNAAESCAQSLHQPLNLVALPPDLCPATHLVVRLHARLVLAHRLLDFLLHPVQTLCIARIHLFPALLFARARARDERLEVEQRAHEHGRKLGRGGEGERERLVARDEAEEFVEFWAEGGGGRVSRRDGRREPTRPCTPLLIATQSLILLAFSMTLTVASISSSRLSLADLTMTRSSSESESSESTAPLRNMPARLLA